MKRKKKWKTSSDNRFCLKTIPKGTSEKEIQTLIEVDCYKGKGNVHLYECNQIIADPDRQDLLENYEFVMDLLQTRPTSGTKKNVTCG